MYVTMVGLYLVYNMRHYEFELEIFPYVSLVWLHLFSGQDLFAVRVDPYDFCINVLYLYCTFIYLYLFVRYCFTELNSYCIVLINCIVVV